MRHASNKWRAIIKHITIINRAILDRLFKGLVLFPELDQRFFVLACTTSRTIFIFHVQLSFLVEQKNSNFHWNSSERYHPISESNATQPLFSSFTQIHERFYSTCLLAVVTTRISSVSSQLIAAYNAFMQKLYHIYSTRNKHNYYCNFFAITYTASLPSSPITPSPDSCLLDSYTFSKPLRLSSSSTYGRSI